MKILKSCTEKHLRLSVAANLLGVTTQTLREWDKAGKIKPVRTEGNQRRIPLSEINRLQGVVPILRNTTLVYARCSTHKQKENLDRQVARLLEYAVTLGDTIELYKDIGSGLNENRLQFQRMLKRLGDPEVKKVLVEYKDRLCRYGFSTFKAYCQTLGIVVEVLEEKESVEFDQEFAEDIVALVASYSARLYGRRGGRKRSDKSKITQDTVIPK